MKIRFLFRILGTTFVIGLITIGIYALGVQFNWYGELEGRGDLIDQPYPSKLLLEKKQKQLKVNPSPKQILFGDTHVHSTYSTDAFLWSLPILNGEGPHPISDACDYARFCSALDFWVTTDHAEASSPRKWKEIKESVRQCNAVANEEDPDLVTFLGYEWTQVGLYAEDHYGHKNVMFLETEEGKVPLRPIGAGGIATDGMRETIGGQADQLKPLAFLDFKNRHRYFNFITFNQEFSGTPHCELGVDSSLLPENCYEYADTPVELFTKLNQLNFDSIVIPHGNTWGFYSPPLTSLDKQLKEGFHDENLQILFEVMSGHGNSEEYRPWRAATINENGSLGCPEPTNEYLPSCWRAGEIIAERCLSEGNSKSLCKIRELDAQQNYLALCPSGYLAIPGAEIEDWYDSGQCKDCFIPSFNYRPAGSAQYALSLTNFEQEKPKRFRFGFIASSDNHRSRPGTGYKEKDRFVTTEANGPSSEAIADILYPKSLPAAESIDYGGREGLIGMGFRAFEVERQASFFTSGGLAAVHSTGRDRQSIWDSMKRKETYGTSGDRILLWFDLINGDKKIPMGGEIATLENPKFYAKAVGSLKQKPGCPDYKDPKITKEDMERICKNECYNPSDERKIITRIEVIKVSPQNNAGEDVGNLIEDPWKVFNCPIDQNGCEVSFEDESYSKDQRDVSYYVRAIQEPSSSVNAKNIRCEYNEKGECIKVNMCYGDYRTAKDDDCLAMIEERAWSSPIFVDYL